MEGTENTTTIEEQSKPEQEQCGKLKAATKWIYPLISIAVILVVGLTTLLSFAAVTMSNYSASIAEDENVYTFIFSLASLIKSADMSEQFAYVKLLIAFVYISAIVAAIAPVILVIMGLCFLPSAIKKNNTKTLDLLAVLTVAISAACQALLVLSQLLMSYKNGYVNVVISVVGGSGAMGGLIAGVVMLIAKAIIKFIATEKNERMSLNSFIKCAIMLVLATVTLSVMFGGSNFSSLFSTFGDAADGSGESILTTCYALVYVQYFIMIGYVALVLAVIISTLNAMLKGKNGNATTMLSIIALIVSVLSLIVSIVIPIMLGIKYGSAVSDSLGSLNIILIAFPVIEFVLSLLTIIIPAVVLNGKSPEKIQ